MIRFQRNLGYFLLQSRKYDAYDDPVDMAIAEFKSKYKCVSINSERGYVYECSEEDFLMITLQCPDAIGRVYGKVS